MKKIALFVILTLSLVGCNVPINQSETVDVSDEDVQVNDGAQVDGSNFVLVKDGDRAEGDQNDVYSGTAVISGQYTYDSNNPFFDFIFTLDEESKNLVPNGELFLGKLYFTNEDALSMLGLDDLDFGTCDVYVGEATVEIDGYKSNLVEGEAMDSTVLSKVTQSSEPICE